ncbi:hypothetical protein [Halalkalibacter akibai]|uniref:hypothetical protein n=1 Tax=Halalkalibacter akibai TaxID=1411 RepID=UPI0011DDD109|nr:hypothetical protein [Halalkalibacter akibai]
MSTIVMLWLAQIAFDTMGIINLIDVIVWKGILFRNYIYNRREMNLCVHVAQSLPILLLYSINSNLK